MLDMGSGGPTRYLVHVVEWNNRRRTVARNTVVVARDIPEVRSVDHPLSECCTRSVRVQLCGVKKRSIV